MNGVDMEDKFFCRVEVELTAVPSAGVKNGKRSRLIRDWLRGIK